MNREKGYYWCKLENKWDIFHWDSPMWSNNNYSYPDSDFEEIDKYKIIKNERTISKR